MDKLDLLLKIYRNPGKKVGIPSRAIQGLEIDGLIYITTNSDNQLIPHLTGDGHVMMNELLLTHEVKIYQLIIEPEKGCEEHLRKMCLISNNEVITYGYYENLRMYLAGINKASKLTKSIVKVYSRDWKHDELYRNPEDFLDFVKDVEKFFSIPLTF